MTVQSVQVATGVPIPPPFRVHEFELPHTAVVMPGCVPTGSNGRVKLVMWSDQRVTWERIY